MQMSVVLCKNNNACSPVTKVALCTSVKKTLSSNCSENDNHCDGNDDEYLKRYLRLTNEDRNKLVDMLGLDHGTFKYLLCNS